jgi:putative membrane protein
MSMKVLHRRASLAVIGWIAALAVFLMVTVAWRPLGLYPWVKALHVIAVIAWMAGLLYLPRLFVYHCEAEPGSQQAETFKVMERRLLTLIMNPALGAVWLLGLWLAWEGGWFASGWLHVKLALVLVMSALHGLFARWAREFATDRNTRPQRFYRMVNELPTVLMVAIVILAVVKPF